MLKTYHYIQNSLQDFYPEKEIKSFSKIIFWNLLNIDLVNVLSNFDKKIDKKSFQQIELIIQRLQNYEPIQYIFEETYFFGLPFYVNSYTLIPRPETEELVEWVLNCLSPTCSYNILDIGTGSGCIAVSLAKKLNQPTVFGYDISEKALEVAKKNAKRNHVEVQFCRFDILNDIFSFPKETFDVIVSNPPYVTESEKKDMSSNVLEYEPETALFVPDDNPLLFYKKIAEFAQVNLTKKGLLFFEINSLFGIETVSLLQKMNYKNITLKKDISGKDRMIKAEI